MATLINGKEQQQISVLDRGLAYGDGIFRTLELRYGQPKLWRWQYARLCEDAARLHLATPSAETLLTELRLLGGTMPRAVAKITLTRGEGQRGYAIPASAESHRIVTVSDWQGYPANYAEQGISARWCDLRLAIQPALAGIKHLNRLENVLARSEWDDPTIQEGLLLDNDGYLVEGTMSNLYILSDNIILTPILEYCGVQGAVRDWLSTYCAIQRLPFMPARLRPAQLLTAQAVFFSNSLIGLWPLRQLDRLSWSPHPLVAQLQQALAQQP
ncbi:aminodeoxychorismate lyase [Neisseriaceae bacterium TC5R-5]|nr:aminodeoxychorismate lyase [Neisseriaceae bacterium TC5R-5]